MVLLVQNTYLSTSEASKLEPGVITPPAPGVVARRFVGPGPGPPAPPVAVPDALSLGV